LEDLEVEILGIVIYIKYSVHYLVACNELAIDGLVVVHGDIIMILRISATKSFLYHCTWNIKYGV